MPRTAKARNYQHYPSQTKDLFLDGYNSCQRLGREETRTNRLAVLQSSHRSGGPRRPVVDPLENLKSTTRTWRMGDGYYYRRRANVR
jgi:hypothetical protein